MRKHIICDIDHTLSNAFHRDTMIGGPWDDYHAASIHDEPLHDISRMIFHLYRARYFIVGLTTRPEKWRQLTMNWLVKHEIPLDELLMRPDKDYRPSPEMKLELAKERFPNILDEVAFVLEDRDDVCAAFKALGLTVLQVHGRAR